MRRFAILLTLVGLLAGCDGNGGATDPSARFLSALDALCAAHREAVDGDVVAARRVFFDRAHQPLHSFAAVSDPVTAKPVLEAKAAVEAALDDPTADVPAEQLATDLLALARALSSAIGRSGDANSCA